MHIEAHDKLSRPLVADVTRLVAYDDHGRPVCVLVQLDERQIHCAHLGDPEFELLLAEMGVEKTVQVVNKKGR